MTGPRGTTDLTTLEDLLRAQWIRLRTWVGELDGATLARPSTLPGWSVADLVAHLARSLDALAACQPAEAGTVPASLGEYVRQYRGDAEHIARVTRETADEIADDLLGGLDAHAAAALAQLQQLRDVVPDPVVRARRGPILLSDMVMTRLVELVVHADDLARSTGRRAPIEPAALDAVAGALLGVVVERGGWDLEVRDASTWLRLATGREPYDTDLLTAALAARHTSDSVPDLGAMLPLL